MAEQTALEEIEVLRRTNAELVKKAGDRKRRIAELVSSFTELQGKLAATQTALYESTVGMPLREMAAEVSPVPELWLAEFARHFKVELQDGKLAVLTPEGKPATLNGATVEFSREGLTSLLTRSANKDYKSFDHIMISSRASGGGSIEASRPFGNSPKPQEDAPAPPMQFGLR